MINQNGIIVEAEKIKFGKRNNYAIPLGEIRVGEHKGKWFMAYSYNLPLQGYGSGVSIKDKPYENKEDAIEAGKETLASHIKSVLSNKHIKETDKSAAEELLLAIEESRQMSLF